MDIEIAKRTEIKAKIYGKDYILTKPTVGQIEEMQGAVDKADSAALKSSLMRTFLAKLGVPEDVSKEMEVDHFLELVEGLTGVKKK